MVVGAVMVVGEVATEVIKYRLKYFYENYLFIIKRTMPLPPVPLQKDSKKDSLVQLPSPSDAPKEVKVGKDTAQIEQLQKSFGTNWEQQNIDTLTNWIWIGAHNIKILNLAISQKRVILRINAMVGILVSTLTGTLSASQVNNENQNTYYITTFTILSFLVAAFNGYMKIAQIQESLEEYIKIKQQWVFFTTLIFSEFQLPIHLRQDALFLIWKYKSQYLDLIKIDLDISPYIRTTAEKMLQTYLHRFDPPDQNPSTNDPKKLNEKKIKRLNNFFHTLLDMPKEAGFSTQLPNLMLDALLFNDSKMIKKAITVPSSSSTTTQGASEMSTTSPNYKDTTSAATKQESTTSTSSSGSSVGSAETLEAFENITTPTPTLMSKGSTIPLTKKKIAMDTAITVGK